MKTKTKKVKHTKTRKIKHMKGCPGRPEYKGICAPPCPAYRPKKERRENLGMEDAIVEIFAKRIVKTKIFRKAVLDAFQKALENL